MNDNQDTFEPGEPVTASMWFEPGQKKRMQGFIEGQLREGASVRGIRLDRIEWSVLDAEHPLIEASPPPGYSREVKLLLAETTVLEILPQIIRPGASFLDDLDAVDLGRLRVITRRGHRRARPDEPPLTDAQCDEVIKQLGPDAAAAAIRRAVDSKAVH